MYEVRERIEITVPGQMTGPACLEVYGNDGGEKKRSEQKVSEQRKKAVIICPGGGYWQVVEREGAPVAKRFAQMGCQTFVLNYSVLPDGFPTSLLELARAVELVRTRADDWDVDPEQILVCGFSAGGHLACSLGVFWNREMVYQTLGEENGENFRPNGMILAYPVITSGQFAHKKFVERLFQHSGGASEEERKLVSLERQVSKDTPRAFIWQTCTDEDVPVENSLLLVLAMRMQGLNVEYHMFPHGPHGLSLADADTSGSDPEFENAHCAEWVSLVKRWME